MQLLERKDIEIEKWDDLVSRKSNGFHSYSWWLDAIAENWSIIVDKEYEHGIALPFTVKAGVKTLYNPIFSEYLEFLGNLDKGLSSIIQKEYPVIECGFEQDVLGIQSEEHVSQIIRKEYSCSKMAQRNLKKGEEAGFTIVECTTIERVFPIIESELIGIANSINERSLKVLKAALNEAGKRGFVRVYELIKGDEIHAGLIFLENGHITYYVKGASLEAAKKSGSMYMLMDHVIRKTLEENKLFNFGGSRVEGVKRFNHQFGAEDFYRPYYSVNNAPGWFKLVKSIRNLVRS